MNDFIIREIDMPADAERLAVMWQASDDQWPGTMSRGIPITPQWVMDMHTEQKMLAIYVAETTDHSRIVGYCSLCERPAEKNTGYLATLNVQPDHQGLGIGRRLVQRCVDRCTELGFHLLAINTWSANLKSVPTYKKCGYFWVPDTSVYLLNFIPPIRQLACAQAYFARHDWYAAFKREITQAEDDERWEGMKVFTYHWEEDGEALTVWADREAQRLTAVETDAFFAAAIADDIEPAQGMTTTLRWRVTNKQARPISVSLIATGNEHLKIEKRATLTLEPGATQEITAEVEIPADAPDLKPNQPVPSVRTLFIIEGEVLELGTGMRPHKPIEISLAPEHVTLLPGVAKTVQLQLHSRLKRDVAATVTLTPAPGLSADWTERAVALSAQGYAGLPVTLRADAGGVCPLLATAAFEGSATRTERLPIFSLPSGGVLADQGVKATRLENEWMRLILVPKAGMMSLIAVQTGVGLGGFREVVGPPFWPSELDEKDFAIALRREDGRAVAVLTATLDDHSSLVVERTVTLGGGPLVEIAHALGNTGATPHTVQLATRTFIWQGDRSTLTLPLQGGMVESRYSEMPEGVEDIPNKPEAFAERWAAIASEYGLLGILWDESCAENEVAWSVMLTSRPLTCAPQQWTPAGRLHLYIGPGDWRTVRAHAHRLTGQDALPEPIPPATRKVYDARLEPAPLLALDDVVTADFVVDNLRGKALTGQATLTLPAGLSADRSAFPLEAVALTQSFRTPVTLSLPPDAAAYEGDAFLETRLFDAHNPVPILRLGNRAAVAVTERDGAFTVDNGRTRFGVAPGFSAALFQWEEDGVNHALSPYPNRSMFDWMNPWYGGIMPIAMPTDDHSFPGKLHTETFTGALIDSPDARGIPWRGVRVSSALQREQLRGLVAEVDYLTVGNSNVLKVVCRARNLTTARRTLFFGLLSFWQPDGTSDHNVIRSEGLERKPNPWISWAETQHWSAVINGQTGRTLIQVSPYPNTGQIDWGAGGHINAFNTLETPPEGTLEREFYFVLCPTWDEAQRYMVLQTYR
ncbi:MAG TPA: GNAT family N-acetyltransferase [Anaerolineae bacterium]|nr:GNAT family N-acetyltransferase [Anaerolineae bacterium]